MFPTANFLEDLVQPLADLADTILVWFHDSAGFSWGLSIILLTVTVRLALVPLTYKQITSMVRMQEFSPQIKEIGEKYKEDPQRKNQEMMKFFQENKINPLASCLPLLFQLPFFIALFYALQDDALQAQIKATGDQFLFINSLVEKAGGFELVVLIVLYVGSQIGSSLVTMTAATDPNQRKLMLALPLVFTVFIINFPAGLILYWITTNFWTLGQSFVVRWMRQRSQAHQELAAAGGDGSVVVDSAVVKAPPPPPRQKKKRSGRRR